MNVRRIHPQATIPARQTPGAAGYDLTAVEDFLVPARGQCSIPTGIQVSIPTGHYGRLAPRSSLAKKGLDVGAGVIDSDYRGEIIVIMYNLSDEDYQGKVKERCAQLIVTPISTPEVREVEDSLDLTVRGDRGFGSTGAI